MALPDESLLAAVCAMSSPSATERERSADEITDYAGSLQAEQALLLSRLLVALRLGEADHACQEAQLNALSELVQRYELEPETLIRLEGLPADSLRGSQKDHYDDIFEDGIRGRRRR